MAAARAGLPEPERALTLGFASGEPVTGEGGEDGSGLARLSAAWAERRHLILRCGPGGGPEMLARRLAGAGVSAETPALLASDLGTSRETLFYGSVEDVGVPGFGAGAVLVVPHPAVLPMDFAWPPTAAP